MKPSLLALTLLGCSSPSYDAFDVRSTWTVAPELWEEWQAVQTQQFHATGWQQRSESGDCRRGAGCVFEGSAYSVRDGALVLERGSVASGYIFHHTALRVECFSDEVLMVFCALVECAWMVSEC